MRGCIYPGHGFKLMNGEKLELIIKAANRLNLDPVQKTAGSAK